MIVDHKLIPKLNFIKEGNFKEKGKPVLRLIGEVKPISFSGSGKNLSGGVRITNDPNVPSIRVEEEDMLKEFPLDFSSLTTQLKSRYSNFKVDKKFHKIKQSLIDQGFAITRKLNPNKQKTSTQSFYSSRIIKEFDKHCT